MRTFFKVISVLLVVCFVFSSTFVFGLENVLDFEQPDNYVYWNGQVADSFESGKGTDSDPYIIKTAEQLAYLSYVVNNDIEDTQNGGYYSKKTYSLENDLYLNDISKEEYFHHDSSAKKWTPIGGQVFHEFNVPTGDHLLSKIGNYCFVYNSEKKLVGYIDNNKFNKNETYYYTNPFKGKFLGNGHTIYGLYVKENKTSAGLFGSTAFAIIENVNIDRAYIFGADYVGGICGYASNYTNIDSCTVNAYIDGSYAVGGIVGRAGSVVLPGGSSAGETIRISNCKSYGYIEAYENAGGIVAEITARNISILGVMLEFHAVQSNISGCANFAEVLSWRDGAGGIAALCSAEYNSLTIEKCYNKGSVEALNNAGGLIGECRFDYYASSKIKNCFNIGSVWAREMAGGLIGFAYANKLNYSQPIEHCYNAGQIFAQGQCGAIVASSKVESSASSVTNSVYCNNCAFVNGTAKNAFGDFSSTYVNNCSDGSDVLAALNDTANIWIADTNNSNGGFPELEEGCDDSGFYVFLETEHPDFIGLDKTLVSKNGTVNILFKSDDFIFPYEYYLDGTLLEEMSFSVSSNHTLKVNFCDKIWIDEVEISLESTEFHYTGEEICPKVIIDGMIEGKDYIVEFYDSNIYPGQGYISLQGIGRMVGRTYMIFDILKGVADKPRKPVVKYKNCFEIQLEKIDGYEYRLDDGEWQAEPNFTGLIPGTCYKVYQRSSETEYYFASLESEATEIVTDKLVTGISVNTEPIKTEYEKNSIVDLTGATIKIEYSDGTYDVIDVERDMIINADTSLVGKSYIVITYKAFDLSFEITVVESLKPVEKGDINCDAAVDAADLAILKKVIANLIPTDESLIKSSNVDGNGSEPDAADLALLKKMIAGLL